MKTLIKITLIAALPSAYCFAQTITPNTTLCAAQNATQNTVCLQSTTGVVAQTIVYVDQEGELVQQAFNAATCTGPCNVPVSRGNRNAGSGPTAHPNTSIAWIGKTPGSSAVPGVTGMNLNANMTLIGSCTRSSLPLLPVIFVNRGIKRDCTAVTNNATAAVWVDYAPEAGVDFQSPSPLVAITANGALSVSSGNYVLTTKAGVIALTLAAPTAGVMDGMVIKITAANGAFADTLTATALLQTGGGSSPYTTATFGVTSAFNGASLTMKAYNGFWYVISSTGVVFT